MPGNSKWLKTWFELSRVKLYRNDLREKNYFELAGGYPARSKGKGE